MCPSRRSTRRSASYNGRLTQEAPDKSKEIFDYDTSTPFFKAWNEEFKARTEGESVGNVREMHQLSAVGKFVDMAYLDDEKAIDACCHVVDDAAWQKVLDKVYTGFSIGGGYVKKWKDGDFTRYTAKPSETSLVDNPCLDKAAITQIIKAEGSDDPTLGELRKGMWEVSRLAELFLSLGWLAQDVAAEAEWEGDNSPVPAALRDAAMQVGEALKQMVPEEVAELLATLPAPPAAEVLQMAEKLAKGELPEGLEKAGAKFSKAAREVLAEVHQCVKDCDSKLASLGYDQSEETDDQQGAEKMAKLDAEKTEALSKVATLEADLQKAQAEAVDLRKQLDAEKAKPGAPKGSITVSKSQDTIPQNESEEEEIKKQAEAIAKLPPAEQALALIKFVHSTGGTARR